jgi:hypothetical protein
MSFEEIDKIASLPVFFIIGRPRSGTTLLQLFFDAHPNVQMPAECMFVSQLYIKYGFIKNWDNEVIDSFIGALCNTFLFTYEKFNIPKIKKELLENCTRMNYNLACRIIMMNFNSVYPKKEIKLLGDKNPYYSECFEYLFPIINYAKYVFIVRDPRDNHISLFNARFYTPSITNNTIVWKKAIKSIEKFSNHFPDRFYTVKYEDLVRDPVTYLKEICNFLSIPFAQEMMSYLDYKNVFTNVIFISDEYLQKNHTSILEPINTDKIGQWKKRLSRKKIKTAERIAGKYLDKYGYERLSPTPGFLSNFYIIPGLLLYYLIALFKFTSILIPLKFRLKLVTKNEMYVIKIWDFLYGKEAKL